MGILFDAFDPDAIAKGLRVLGRDAAFARELEDAVGSHGSMRDRVRRLERQRRTPAKYLGIELDSGETRFSFPDTVRLLLKPRSQDGSRSKLRLSNHAQAMRDELPDIADMLSDNATFGPLCNDAVKGAAFERSKFASAIRPALKKLQARTGVPVKVSLAVLKKGSFAYGSSHRPGMSRFGWARARLSSFLFKGCTFFSPDHLLAAEAMAASDKAKRWWRDHPKCLCRKRQQCGKPGRSVSANSVTRRGSRRSRPSARKPRPSRAKRSSARKPRRSRR